jgi:glycosyltransferase involved in cell wall biosynthesis
MRTSAAHGQRLVPEESGRPSASSRTARPRLLYLVGGFDPDGDERAVLMLAPEVARSGFEVTVVALGAWGEVGAALEERGVRAAALGGRGALDGRAAGRLLSALRRERIQIVHALQPAAAVAARLYGRLAGALVVTTQGDSGAAPVRSPGPASGLALRLALRCTVPLSDAVVARSEASRRTAIEKDGLRPGLMHIVREGAVVPDAPLDQEARRVLRRSLGAGLEDRLIGVHARLQEPHPGLATFLAAGRRMTGSAAAARLIVSGDGPSRRALERRAEREGVSHRTLFAGTPPDAAERIAALDVFVDPEPRADARLALLEAMARGVPVVAARAPATVDLLADGEAGLLVPPGDPEALARACADLLDDPVRARRCAAAALARAAAAHGIERAAAAAAGLYRALLEARRGGALREQPGGGA